MGFPLQFNDPGHMTDEMLHLFTPFLSVTTPVIGLDENGTIRQANAAAHQVLGDQIVGSNLVTVLCIESSAICKCVKAAIESGWAGIKNDVTLDHDFGDSFPLPVTFSCVPQRVESEVKGVVMIISFGQQGDHILTLEKKALFEAFMANCPVPAWIADEDCRLFYMNRMYRETFHLGDDDLNRIPEIFPPEYLKLYQENNRNVIAEGKTVETIEDGYDQEGRYKVFKMFKFPVYMEDGKSLVAGWMVDLTNVIETKQALKKSNERYQYALKATSDVIWEWDVMNESVYIGDGYEELLGHTTTTELNTLLSHVHPSDLALVQNTLQQSVHKHEMQWQIESRYICANGDIKRILNKGFNVWDEEGKLVKVIGALQDITSFKELQGQLLKEQEERNQIMLEAMVQGQEKERQSIGVELHDNVNQQLVTVQLLLQAVRTMPDKQEECLQKSIDVIGTALQDIRQLSHQLIAPTFGETNFADSIREVVESLSMAGIKVHVQLPVEKQLNSLEAGLRLTIYRVIQEQLNNIIKYAQAKQVMVSIQMEKQYLRLTIKDDGVGFDPQQKRRGIGLSNINSRAKLHKGSVHIDASIGGGCEITLSIPL